MLAYQLFKGNRKGCAMLLDYQNAREMRTEQSIEPFGKDQIDRMRKINRDAFTQAVKEANAINWLEDTLTVKGSVANLGEKIGKEYALIFNSLDNAEELTPRAGKWLWIGIRESQLTWLGWIDDGLVEDNATARNYAAKFEDGHEGGLVYAVYMKLSEIAYCEALNQEGVFKGYSDPDLMFCIALIWFWEADALMGSGNINSALDRIADAYSAIQLARDNLAGEYFKSQASSSAARRAATARHTNTYELRDKIINFWRDNISADQSNEFAAELLQKEFPHVGHRTLARYVSEAKKLPPDVMPGTCPFYDSQ